MWGELLIYDANDEILYISPGIIGFYGLVIPDIELKLFNGGQYYALYKGVEYYFAEEAPYVDSWVYMIENDIIVEAEPGYIPLSTTWLTFNTYTPEQWAGYHFQGNQWNNIGSPWAYAGNMTTNGSHNMVVVDYEPCEPGNYVNVFSITDQTDTIAEDTYGHVYGTDSDDYYNNIGPLYFFGADEVSSNNRSAYPDNGYQGRYYYLLKPEKTKFIEYYEDTTTTTDVKLDKDRYKYSHNNTYYNLDTSLYNTVVGTASSTNESAIPDATWRKYLGIYFGESIPFLNIVEQHIPPADILGVPTYDKQINTSETLKYGTVASAAITFVLNMPVDEAMAYNSDLLILFYDFKNTDEWERLGFFYVDSIEAIDEYTTRITAHDEAYKLNKYVDSYLEGYGDTTPLKSFFYELLDFCGCYYDTAMPNFQNSAMVLDNVYHAVKTTGTEVAHYIASLVPAFIHADIDSDIVVGTYQTTGINITTDMYADLTYCAYNSDNVNRVKITINNNVMADSGVGENIYYLADNPLINSYWADSKLSRLAIDVKDAYTSIPAYRPATVQFLTLPSGIEIGKSFIIHTLTNQTYRINVMKMTIDASGIKIESMGTQQYPIEASESGQFTNIINDISVISGDVADISEAQAATASDLVGLTASVYRLDSTVSSLSTRMGTAEANITTNASTISGIGTRVGNLETTISGLPGRVSTLETQMANTISTVSAMSISKSGNLATAKINGNTVSEIVLKDYVDAVIVGSTLTLAVGSLEYGTTNENTRTIDVFYIGDSSYNHGIYVPYEQNSNLPALFRTAPVYGSIYGYNSGG